jgi:hypothetical protein
MTSHAGVEAQDRGDQKRDWVLGEQPEQPEQPEQTGEQPEQPRQVAPEQERRWWVTGSGNHEKKSYVLIPCDLLVISVSPLATEKILAHFGLWCLQAVKMDKGFVHKSSRNLTIWDPFMFCLNEFSEPLPEFARKSTFWTDAPGTSYRSTRLLVSQRSAGGVVPSDAL